MSPAVSHTQLQSTLQVRIQSLKVALGNLRAQRRGRIESAQIPFLVPPAQATQVDEKFPNYSLSQSNGLNMAQLGPAMRLSQMRMQSCYSKQKNITELL